MNKKEILNEILENYSPKEQERIIYAYSIAEKVFIEKRRENGEPFIEHPLGVAQIIAKEVGLDSDAIVSIFLHESIRFDKDALKEVKSDIFSKEIIEIALSLNKIAAIKPKDTRLEAENYKRLIASYSKDPRVTIIKLADRLEVMRNLELLPKSSQERKLAETIMLYIPIAHQLGLYRLKSELEDIFFRHSDPENYRLVTNKLSATKSERERLAESFVTPLHKKIASEGVDFTIKTRTKTAYSIWKKMTIQGVPFEKVFDVFAIRIIIDSPIEKEKELCWKVYSIVTEEFEPDTSRLRDWITVPKTNGYESLHTTVSNSDGCSVEVQIRTRRMDEVAENGYASHWSYKGVQGGSLDQWLARVRVALESSDSISYQQLSGFLKEEVFVFAPDGALRRLPLGATVLDFAFDIHTNLGLTCSGATVNGKVVSIREKLKNGETVSIMSNKNQKPSPDWLNFVVTSKARNKIKQKLKEEETKKANIGKELLERRVKNWKLELTDEDMGLLCKHYKQKTITDLYSAIGEEKINIAEIKDFLTERKKGEGVTISEESRHASSDQSGKKGDPNVLVIDGKLGNVGYKMAKCCNPIYGDDVFGFVSIKEGIKIHRITCPNAARLIENYPYRVQKVKWKADSQTSGFQTMLKIVIDDSATYPTVMERITGFNIPLRSSSLSERSGRGKGDFDVKVQILVSSNQQLDKVIMALKKTKGVISVLRGNG